MAIIMFLTNPKVPEYRPPIVSPRKVSTINITTQKIRTPRDTNKGTLINLTFYIILQK